MTESTIAVNADEIPELIRRIIDEVKRTYFEAGFRAAAGPYAQAGADAARTAFEAMFDTVVVKEVHRDDAGRITEITERSVPVLPE